MLEQEKNDEIYENLDNTIKKILSGPQLSKGNLKKLSKKFLNDFRNTYSEIRDFRRENIKKIK